MSISRKGLSLFLCLAVLLTFVPLVTFSANPLVPATVVNASGWAGWDSMDTIAILPVSDVYLDTAAQELKTHLDAMSGRSWTIAQSDVAGPAIRLDVNQTAPEFADLSEEAVRILSDMQGISIIGKTPMAARHGTYILLEKVGVRWFFKDPAFNYTPPSLVDIGVINEVNEPSYLSRRISSPPNMGADAREVWNMRNRLIGPAVYHTLHSYNRIINISEYAAHPDWFIGNPPDGEWQLNPENPEVIDRCVQYARDILNEPPAKKVFGCDDLIISGSACISPNDGGGFDPPYDASDRQLMTDKVFYLANEVAKVIGTEFPDRYISLFSYYVYANIPSFDLDPHLLPFVTTNYNYGTLTLIQQIEGFYAKGVEVGIFDFVKEWIWGEDDPLIPWDQIRRIRTFNDSGNKFYVGLAGDGWGGGNGLAHYLITKLLWDHTADVDALLDDFYTKSFGPAKQVMKHYYENRGLDDAALKTAFQDLNEAETLAEGNSAILERIRHLEYYTRYVWKWHNVGITNLTLDELKSFYTFYCKIRDTYMCHYNDGRGPLRTELENRGLTVAEIDALMDFTPPTAAEARAWLDEALTAFTGDFIPYINPRVIEIQALGDTTQPRLDVPQMWYQEILVPSMGNEDVVAQARGTGQLQWYGPGGLFLDYENINSPTTYVPVTFRATEPGTYILHSTFARPVGSSLAVDVPDRPASIIAHPTRDIFSAIGDANQPRNAPATYEPTAHYFYVPSGTMSFVFGAACTNPDWPVTCTLTDPNGVTYPFNFTEPTTEIELPSPVSGIWKVETDRITFHWTFWLIGIPPLIWHDSEYLLVQVQGNSEPVANNQSVSTTVDTPINITLSAYDPNSDPLTYAIVTSPSHGILSGTPPGVTYTPNSGFVGSDSFTFKVNDSSTDSNQATVFITISDSNYPIIDAIGDKSVNQGIFLEFTISASDPNSDPLTYSASNLPNGASFDSETRTFSWTPRYDQAGLYTVHFEVSDGQLTDSEDVNISVFKPYEDWDVNGDGAANVLDMVLVGQHWGETGLTGWIPEDANEDGIINVLDMIVIGQNLTE